MIYFIFALAIPYKYAMQGYIHITCIMYNTCMYMYITKSPSYVHCTHYVPQIGSLESEVKVVGFFVSVPRWNGTEPTSTPERWPHL